MSSAVQQVLIAANPKSGASSSANQVDGLRAQLVQRNIEPFVCTDLQEIRERANSLHASGDLRCVVSAGGDGTLGLLANMLPPDIPFQILPLGTENLFAKQVGVSSDLRQIASDIEQGKTQEFDAGLANDKLFFVMASCGFDAEVVREMDKIREGHINRWSYAGPIFKALRNYRFPSLRIQVDGQETNSAAWAFVFNAPQYAANLDFCPQADAHDGLLDLCRFEKPGILQGCFYFWKLWRKKHQGLQSFGHSRGKTIQILPPVEAERPQVEIPYQLDGDPGGFLPLKLESLPSRLKLIVPSD